MFSELRYPIVQAPTGGIAGPELAAAVSRAGGLGTMGLTWTRPEAATQAVRAVRAITHAPFGVNFALAFPPDSLVAALEAGAPVVLFSWGDPRPYLPLVRSFGAKVGAQVGNFEGVRPFLDAGVDFLIAQGLEAGGHVQSSTPLKELLVQIAEVAQNVPLVAAGGLATGMQVAEVLRLGADAAMLGTRFVAATESRAHAEYKRLLTVGTKTALTQLFDGGWPFAAHRVLRNSTLEAWEAAGCPAPGERPREGDILATTAEGAVVTRYDDMAPRVGTEGDIEAMCLYAGAGVGEIEDIAPAGELIERLWRECEAARIV